MLARFRKRNRKRFRQMGGSFDIPQHKQSAGSDEALAQHNADTEANADAQVAANKVGGRRRKYKTRRRQVGGEKFTVPQDRNAGEDGNASMRKSSEMLAQSQADQSHDAKSGGGRKRRRTRRTRRKRKRKTKRRKRHYKKKKTKRYRKRR